MGRVWLEGSGRTVLECPNGTRAVHAAGAQELGYFDRPQSDG